MKKTKAKRKAKQTNKPTLIVLLLDRSGSMASCMGETISGFNTYVETIQKSKANKNSRMTFVQFDTAGIDTINDASPVGEVKLLNDDTYKPRAMTPLYDAMGKTINSTKQHAGSKYKVLFVTLTDGMENASSSFSLNDIRSLIKEMEDKHHWTFTYIGVGIDGFNQLDRVAVGTQSASNVLRTDHKNQKRSFARAAGQTVSYASSVTSASNVVTSFWGKDKDDTK